MTFGGNGQDWPPRRRGNPQDEALDNLREVAERINDLLRRISPWTILPILLALYMLTGIYTVAPDERAVVLRFGKAVRETGPGPNYHVPWPVEDVIKVPVTRIRKEEVGFRTISPGPPARYRQVENEALMLTGDNNIVDLDFIIQYRVKSTPNGPTNFLFKVSNPDQALRDAAEAAMREVIGASEIDDALTEGKEHIQVESEKNLQAILDQYESGIEVVTLKLQDVGPPEPVSDAFKDVISAEQDKERLINEARGYSNDIVPKARGQAAQLLNEAQAYLETKVRDAEGNAQRFIAVYNEYAKAKEVTKRRLYIETMEEVLGRVDKIILDDAVSQQVVPYLPLEQLGTRKPRSDQGGSPP